MQLTASTELAKDQSKKVEYKKILTFKTIFFSRLTVPKIANALAKIFKKKINIFFENYMIH